jgi:hypothetical protein
MYRPDERDRQSGRPPQGPATEAGRSGARKGQPDAASSGPSLRGPIRRGSPEWQAAIDAALAEAIAAGRLPRRPSAQLLDRAADLIVLKERERGLRTRRAPRPDPQ